MEKVSTSELKQGLGTVLDKAEKAPISITRHGREKFVLISADMFDRLYSAKTQQSYGVDELPDDLANLLLKGAMSE